MNSNYSVKLFIPVLCLAQLLGMGSATNPYSHKIILKWEKIPVKDAATLQFISLPATHQKIIEILKPKFPKIDEAGATIQATEFRGYDHPTLIIDFAFEVAFPKASPTTYIAFLMTVALKIDASGWHLYNLQNVEVANDEARKKEIYEKVKISERKYPPNLVWVDFPSEKVELVKESVISHMPNETTDHSKKVLDLLGKVNSYKTARVTDNVSYIALIEDANCSAFWGILPRARTLEESPKSYLLLAVTKDSGYSILESTIYTAKLASQFEEDVELHKRYLLVSAQLPSDC